MRKISYILPLLLLLASCGSKKNSGEKKELSIAVSIAPIAWVTKQIVGDDVKITTIADKDPTALHNEVEKIKAISKSTHFFQILMPYEQQWVPKFKEKNSSLEVVHVGDNIEYIGGCGHPHHDHGHGHGHDHDHSSGDPHIWTSIKNLKIIADNIKDAVTKYDPDNKEKYEQNYKKLLVKLNSVNAKLEEILGPKKGKAFMVYHPAWTYLAKDFGLHQLPIEHEGKEPSPKALEGLIEAAKENNIKIICVQPQFPYSASEKVAEAIGAKVITLDPLLENLDENLINVAKTLSQHME